MSNFNPPVIYHHASLPAQTDRYCLDAAFNLRLSERETTLLRYYAGCSNGFRPALRDIERQTGIAANKVSEVRRGLVRRGIVFYDRRKIVLLWDRISVFASLPERLGKRDSIHGNFFPRRSLSGEPTIGQLAAEYWDEDAIPDRGYRPHEGRRLSASERHFLATISSMTERQYEQFLEFKLPRPRCGEEVLTA